MAAHRWTLYDPIDDSSVKFPINPKDGALPSREKQYEAQRSTGGVLVMFEGRQAVPIIRVTGFLQKEAHHQFWNTWFEKTRAVKITDDLGQQWWAYLTKFIPTRRNRTTHKWSATYDAELVFIRWEPDAP